MGWLALESAPRVSNPGHGFKRSRNGTGALGAFLAFNGQGLSRKWQGGGGRISGEAFGAVGIPSLEEASFAVSLADGRLFAALPAAPTGVADTHCGFHPRKRKALVTTHTELTLLAAAAIIGFRLKPAHANAPAATGMQIAL